MRAFRYLVVSIVLTLGVALAAPQIRILLDSGLTQITLRFGGGHRGFVDGFLRFEATAGLAWPLVVEGDRLVVDGESIGRSVTFESVDGLIEWDGNRYRGAIRIVATGGGLRVINVLGLEDYLRGVVPAEMQASWPIEALKAQAVAARSYTLSSLDPEGDYDLCATIECQVYRGVEVEHPRSDQAIRETAGVVLTYAGEFARTYYHADSGGAVASSAEVWGVALPYLVARADVGGTTPHRSWRLRFDPGLVAQSLSDRGWELGTVQGMRILAYSDSGRVTQLQVSGTAGQRVLRGGTLTGLLRQWGLKSTRFTLLDGLTAQGDGWGHGVGMSQYGARVLAQSSQSYGQILAFYYPNTSLQQLAYGRAP